MDEKSGITDAKEFVKEFSGLNAVVDIIDKFVEDGDEANYSLGEKSWDFVKGAGDAIDGFIGTQGLAFVGTLQGAALAASKMGLGAVFSATTNAVFGVQGVTMMADGAAGVYNAENEEQTRASSAEFTTGAILTAGAVKSGVESYKNYNAAKNAHAEQIANARKTLGLEDGVELTAKSLKEAHRTMTLKNHPDKGGSADAMAEINNAYNILKTELNIGTKTTPFTSKATAAANSTNSENAIAKYFQTDATTFYKMYNVPKASNKPIISINTNDNMNIGKKYPVTSSDLKDLGYTHVAVKNVKYTGEYTITMKDDVDVSCYNVEIVAYKTPLSSTTFTVQVEGNALYTNGRISAKQAEGAVIRNIANKNKPIDVNTATQELKAKGIEVDSRYDPPSNSNKGEGSIYVTINGQTHNIGLGRDGARLMGVIKGEPAVHYYNTLEKYKDSGMPLRSYLEKNDLPGNEVDFLKLVVKET